MFTQQEIDLIVNLINSQNEAENLLIGFGEKTREEKERDLYYEELIKKIKKLK